jgi:hypothetical protein
VAALLAGIGMLAVGFRLADTADWIFVALGAVFTAGASYWLIRNTPRLSLSGTGIE